MRYRYAPLHPGQEIPFLGLVSPGVYDLDREAVESSGVLVRIPGIDGNPCLIPLDEAPGAAAAAFIAAISEPTPFNPETPAAAVSVPSAEPVKRKPGRPKKDPA